MVAVLFKAGDHEPVMPLFEVAGRAAKGSPEQMGATGSNVGITFGLTVFVNVVVVPHWPVPGVNVYVPLAVLLTTTGLQVPVNPFDEVSGKVTTGSPSQIVALVPKGKTGVIFGFTVTVSVVPSTHPADVAVNVYVPELAASITAGDHVPVMPLADVLGNTGTVPFWHIVREVPNEKVALTFGITTMLSVTGMPQVPAAGVKV